MQGHITFSCKIVWGEFQWRGGLIVSEQQMFALGAKDLSVHRSLLIWAWEAISESGDLLCSIILLIAGYNTAQQSHCYEENHRVIMSGGHAGVF